MNPSEPITREYPSPNKVLDIGSKLYRVVRPTKLQTTNGMGQADPW